MSERDSSSRMSASQTTFDFEPTAPLRHLQQASVAGAAAVLRDRLRRDHRRGARRDVDDLAARVLVLALAAEGDREHLAVSALAHQPDRRILHRHLRAEVPVDPLHRRALVRHGALRDEVVDVVRPVLDGGVAAAPAALDHDLDDRGVQRVGGVDRRGAALDVVHVRVLVDDDERALELAHVLRVDAEVGLEGHLDPHARRHVDERPARPHGGVECGELVVVLRDDRAHVLLDDVLVLAQARVHVEEEHTLRLEVGLELVVHDLGLVLRPDAGEVLLLRLRDPQLVPGVLDVGRQVLHESACFSVGRM